jgi:uncharacterized protein YbjT (DUF2867 family)
MQRFSGFMGPLLAIMFAVATGLSGCASSGSDGSPANGVLVAGATGGTGRALVRQLVAQGYAVTAFVRDEKKARVILGDDIAYAVGDVRDPDSIEPALAGVGYVISSIGSTRSDPDNNPEAVDYNGVRNLAEVAAAAGVRQFVLVSSAGVTQEDHFLNKAFDNVMKWKLRGEDALRASGVPYTVVRPGGLVNTPGGNQVEFGQGDTLSGRISREDLAAVCVAAIREPAAVGKTFEVAGAEVPGPNDWPQLFGALQPD